MSNLYAHPTLPSNHPLAIALQDRPAPVPPAAPHTGKQRPLPALLREIHARGGHIRLHGGRLQCTLRESAVPEDVRRGLSAHTDQLADLIRAQRAHPAPTARPQLSIEPRGRTLVVVSPCTDHQRREDLPGRPQ